MTPVVFEVYTDFSTSCIAVTTFINCICVYEHDGKILDLLLYFHYFCCCISNLFEKAAMQADIGCASVFSLLLLLYQHLVEGCKIILLKALW